MPTLRYFLLVTNFLFLVTVLYGVAALLHGIVVGYSLLGSRVLVLAICLAILAVLNLIYLWRMRPAGKDGRRYDPFLGPGGSAALRSPPRRQL